MNGLYKTNKKEAPPPRNQFVDSVVRFFASGFYSGYVPVIPGTTGAALGVLVYQVTLLKMHLKPLELFLVYLVLFLIGSFLSRLAVDTFTEADSNLIVIDKMLGGMVAVSAFSPLVWHHAFGRILIAFAIYRLWEIAKGFPLKPLEKLPKGFGLMADDIAAAIIALVITLHMPPNVWDSLGLTLPVVVPKP